MKIIINGMAVEVSAAADVHYDVANDTLNISTKPASPVKLLPRLPPPAKTKAAKRKYRKRAVIPPDMSKSTLTNKVLGMLEDKITPVSMQTLTIATLGQNAELRPKNYLKFLMNELVHDGIVLQSLSKAGRRQFLPGPANQPSAAE